MHKKVIAFLIPLTFLVTGCQTDSREQVLKTSVGQVELRSMQTRAFDTTDNLKMQRTVIATLQDLGFVIDKADATLGTSSGTKFGKTELGGYYQLKMSVTVRERGKKQLLVRANAQYGVKAIEDPTPYQDFFTALEKAIFLKAQNVD